MIHQVKLPKISQDLLQDLVDLQIELLKIAVDHQDLQHHPEIVERELGRFYNDVTKTNQAANWIIEKKQNTNRDDNDLFKALYDFAKYTNTSEKRKLVKDMEKDVSLLSTPQAKTLQGLFVQRPPEWQKSAKEFLIEFYNIFGKSGFPQYLFRNAPNLQNPYHRWDFIDAFTSENSELGLCAVCDSTLYRTSIDNRPYASIEHFFPKARYPHLVIHPRNLIPICPYCNSGAAGATDPFGDDGLGLHGLLLPYQGDKGLRDQTYIAVKSRSGRDNKHPFELEMLPNKENPNVDVLIKNFERIYKVKSRWNDDLDLLDQHVFRRITQFLLGDVQNGNDLRDPQFVEDRLKLIMAIISMDNLGQDPFGFATIWLIKYHIDSIISDGPNSPIYGSLKDWASSQQFRWNEYRDHANHIIERVPKESN